MGMLHFHREAVPLASLIRAASGIALVRPADPSQVVEEVTVGGYDGPPDRPGPPSVSYRIAHDRFVVEEWLRSPRGAPGTIEVASPHNEASARDARDFARGMFGHVHHVVQQFVLEDVPEEWKATPDGRRILFLAPQFTDPTSPRFTPLYGGLSLGPAAIDAIRAAAKPPPAPPARRGVPTGLLVGLLVLVLLIAAAIVVSGCRCAPEEPIVVEEPHFPGWDALVEATWRGDVERARLLAVDLTGGPPAEGEIGADGVTTVGGALGFFGFAEDDAERIGAIATAARGCAECHAARDVPAPPRPAWVHENGAVWAVDAVVWGRTGEPATGDPPLDVLSVAWTDPVAVEPPHTDLEGRAARVLSACAGCHRPR